VVYTRFFEGVEVGNPSDGYLSATGDNDTSDPYNGMDGTGPWFQQVGGGFSDGGSYGGGTRFPCTYRFSFWRSSYTLGVATIPPASTALTENVVTVTVSTGAVVFPDGRVITSADGAVTLASVPLVSGGALATDPRTNDGTVSFALQCQNTETTFSVQARIRWATQRRQHILYGTVRECYEEGTPCAAVCSGSPPPNSVYLTISNIRETSTGLAALSGDEATYVLSRIPNFCFEYSSPWSDTCADWAPTFGPRSQLITLSRTEMYMERHEPRPACIGTWLRITNTGSPWDFCVSGSTVASGTSGQWGNEGSTFGTFDWTISK
jgi:hypothetical protein